MVQKRVFFSQLYVVKTITCKNVPPAGHLERGLTSRGFAATGFGSAETISALVGYSVLAYDAASTYCTG